MTKHNIGYSPPLAKLATLTEFSQVEKFVEAQQAVSMASNFSIIFID